jgi:hypothetical protein
MRSLTDGILVVRISKVTLFKCKFIGLPIYKYMIQTIKINPYKIVFPTKAAKRNQIHPQYLCDALH